MKNTCLFMLVLMCSTVCGEEKQTQKAEMDQAEQLAQPVPINLNFTVATSNTQDAGAKNTTSTTATQSPAQTAPQPQIIIVKHEHQQESMARGIFFTVLSAGLHAGVAIFTGGKSSSSAAAKPAVILPHHNPMTAAQMQRMLEIVKRR